jgi:ATP-dependent RNA helicase DeaD
MVHLLLDIGRDGGLRPADVVGAIANLVGMPGQDIGAIDIHDRFALVEVPAHYQQQVIDKLSGATIRGREVRIRVADHREQRRGRRTEPGVKGRAGAVRRRPTPPPRKRR